MLSEQQLVEKWRKLPTLQQQKVIQFLELLENQESDRTLPTIEIWSPYDSTAAAQDLLKLVETKPREEPA